MTNILAKMAVRIEANTADFNKGLNQASTGLKTFTSNVQTMVATLATAFSIREVANFTLEMNKLAGTFEGVQRAFVRLPNSTLLMDKLQESTHGTVDQLTLMQQALRAKNFGISVKDLGTYLEFAAIRAQQTGESIDYMVNSIILGLGRGSIKILDNLQVNISKIKETVKETGVSLQEAFRQQVVEQMKVIGGYAETSATEVDRLNVAFKSLRLEVAKTLESSGLVRYFAEATEAMKVFIKASGNPLRMQIVSNLERVEKDAIKRAKVFTNSLTGDLDEQKEAVQQQMNTLVELINKRNDEVRKVNEELKLSGTGLDTLDKREGLVGQSNAMKANILTMQRQIEILKEYLKNLNTGADAAGKFVDNLNFMKQELELLNDDFEKTDKNDKKKLINIGNEIKALDAQIKKLEELRKAKEVKPLKMEFIFDAEAEGSTNLDLINERAINDAKEFSKQVVAIGTSAEFAGGALIHLEEPLNDFKVTAEEMVNISGIVAGGIMDISNAFGEAASGSINFGDAILKSLASFAQQFGALLIASGIGEIAFKKFSGPAMIAAGAALVAIGGAVRGAISNRPNLGGKGGSGGGKSFSSQNYALAQNSPIQLSLDGVIRGQDLYVMLANYEKNNKSTRSGG
jgi:hypothetical protein